MVRAYAYDLLNFLRFLAERHGRLADVVPTDLFDYLDWQQRPGGTAGRRVVRLAERRGAAPSTMNRRVAAVRGLFEFAVMSGVRAVNPVPAARPRRRGRGPVRLERELDQGCVRPINSSRMGHLLDVLTRVYRVLGFEDAAGGDEPLLQLADPARPLFTEQIERLASRLDPASALVIFPEGANWTPGRGRDLRGARRVGC